MGDLMNDAIFSMAEAKFAMGDFNQMVLNRTDKAQLKATAKKDNVAGIFVCPILISCFLPRYALVQSAVLRSHVVCLSLRLSICL